MGINTVSIETHIKNTIAQGGKPKTVAIAAAGKNYGYVEAYTFFRGGRKRAVKVVDRHGVEYAFDEFGDDLLGWLIVVDLDVWEASLNVANVRGVDAVHDLDDTMVEFRIMSTTKTEDGAVSSWLCDEFGDAEEFDSVADANARIASIKGQTHYLPEKEKYTIVGI